MHYLGIYPSHCVIFFLDDFVFCRLDVINTTGRGSSYTFYSTFPGRVHERAMEATDDQDLNQVNLNYKSFSGIESYRTYKDLPSSLHFFLHCCVLGWLKSLCYFLFLLVSKPKPNLLFSSKFFFRSSFRLKRFSSSLVGSPDFLRPL